MNIKKFAKDVRGAALVYVIVAAAIIVLLGAATTATAYVNLRATQVQEQSDNNFYSADMIMNAILSGLEEDMSRAYDIAYTEVITRIDEFEDNPTAMTTLFNEKFSNEFNNMLNDGQESVTDENYSFQFFYKPDHIQNYVANVFGDDIRYTVTALNGNNYLDLTEDGLVLRNLHVTYEDDSGYFDEITTDVKVKIPQMNNPIVPLPSFDSVVIDDGLQIQTSCGLTINGNTYIDEDENNSAIYLNNDTSLSIISPKELIAGGKIYAGDMTTLTLRGTNESYVNEIWTENIRIGRNTKAIIKGITHVYDDLEVNGTDSSLKLSGEYYGYKGPYINNNQSTITVVDKSESSSININGARASIDIRELDMLVLAGSSYIDATEHDTGDLPGNGIDLQLGEAFSVKSNQIAYMVDDKICVENGIRYVPSNPMSYTQYNEMCDSFGGWPAVHDKILKEAKLSFNKEKTYESYGATITPVFSGANGGTVYLYLNFADANQAGKYFNDAYAGDSLLSVRLRTYAAQYLSSLQLGENTVMLAGKNYIQTTGNFFPAVLSYTANQLENQEPGSTQWFDYEQTVEEVQKSIYSMSQKIEETYIGDGKIDSPNCGTKYKVHYSKLIDEGSMREFIQLATRYGAVPDTHTNSTIEVIQNDDMSIVVLKGTSDAVAILVDNAVSGVPYELDPKYSSGLIVTTGDLIIKSNWLGSIIVGGTATCTGGGSITPINITVNEAITSSVTPLYISTTVDGIKKSMMVINVFQGCQNLVVNNATNDHGINADQISSCISFTNWNRD